MIIVIGENIKNNIRGVLQIWLLEVKPNVFVGDVNNVIEAKIVKFISGFLNDATDLMLIRSNKESPQGFLIDYKFQSKDKLVNLNGMQFVQKHP